MGSHKDVVVDEDAWRWFLTSTRRPWCWFCGRGMEHSTPEASLVIERAHIVSKPRLKDRRVAILLCSLCHGFEHRGVWGANTAAESYNLIDRISVSEMLWIKQAFDPEYFDSAVLEACHVGNLPGQIRPSQRMRLQYLERRPEDVRWYR